MSDRRHDHFKKSRGTPTALLFIISKYGHKCFNGYFIKGKEEWILVESDKLLKIAPWSEETTYFIQVKIIKKFYITVLVLTVNRLNSKLKKRLRQRTMILSNSFVRRHFESFNSGASIIQNDFSFKFSFETLC